MSSSLSNTPIEKKSKPWYQKDATRKIMIGGGATLVAGLVFWIASILLSVQPVQSETEENKEQIEEVEEKVDSVDEKVDDDIIPTLERIDERTKELTQEK